jgi:hypothetical protein
MNGAGSEGPRVSPRATGGTWIPGRQEPTPLFSSVRSALSCRAEGYPSCRNGLVALALYPKDLTPVTYEYRIFIVHNGEELTFSHFSSEKLWDGAVLRASKPGAELDGQSVAVYRVVSHPTDHGPGIAYGRGADS